MIMSAASVTVSKAPIRGAGAGPTPSAALHSIRVAPIPFVVARRLFEREHYLHSMPGGTMLSFGVPVGKRLLGAITFGVGPQNAYCLVEGASPDDCLTLTRLWLSDELPSNSESRVIGIVLRSLRSHTRLKFLVSYSDPSVGHVGIVYQASGWLYTGLSEPMPLYDIGDGVSRHSRSLADVYGSHSLRYFATRGITVRVVNQKPKHRYIYFLDPTWRSRLRAPELPYPKREVERTLKNAGSCC